MSYIDAYILAVKTEKKQAFLTHAQKMDSIFLDHGATRVTECWADDVQDGKLTSFPLAVKAQPDETIALGMIFWPDKATRTAGMAAAMADPRFTNPEVEMPFDGKRMIFGGFETLFDQKA